MIAKYRLAYNRPYYLLKKYDFLATADVLLHNDSNQKKKKKKRTCVRPPGELHLDPSLLGGGT